MGKWWLVTVHRSECRWGSCLAVSSVVRRNKYFYIEVRKEYTIHFYCRSTRQASRCNEIILVMNEVLKYSSPWHTLDSSFHLLFAQPLVPVCQGVMLAPPLSLLNLNITLTSVQAIFFIRSFPFCSLLLSNVDKLADKDHELFSSYTTGLIYLITFRISSEAK